MVDQFQYIGNDISSTEYDVNIRIGKVYSDGDNIIIIIIIIGFSVGSVGISLVVIPSLNVDGK